MERKLKLIDEMKQKPPLHSTRDSISSPSSSSYSSSNTHFDNLKGTKKVSGDNELMHKINSNNFESLFDSGYGSTTHSVNDANIFTSQTSIDEDILPSSSSIASLSTPSLNNFYSTNKNSATALSSSSASSLLSSKNVSSSSSSFSLSPSSSSQATSASAPYSLASIKKETSIASCSGWQDSGLCIDSGLSIDTNFYSKNISANDEEEEEEDDDLNNDIDDDGDNLDDEDNEDEDDKNGELSYLKRDKKASQKENIFIKPKYKANQENFIENDKVNQLNFIPINIDNSSFILNAYQPNEDGDTLLHLAIIQLMTDLTLELIKRVPHPDLLNITNNLLQTPLQLAIITKQKVIIRHLILSGCKLEIRNRNGNTALHIACQLNDYSLIEILIRSFNDHRRRNQYEINHFSNDKLLNIRNYEGETCIHLAVKNGNKKIVEYLISEGANIDAQDGKCGKAALHWAIEEQNIDIAQHLLQRCNASVNVINYSGLTPLHIAWKMLNINPNNQRIRTLICLLRDNGGEPRMPPSSFDSDNDLSSGEDSNDGEDTSNYIDDEVYLANS